VGADDGDSLRGGLCNQHAVERVAVVERQRHLDVGIADGDREDGGPQIEQCLVNPWPEWLKVSFPRPTLIAISQTVAALPYRSLPGSATAVIGAGLTRRGSSTDQMTVWELRSNVIPCIP